jgi:hypothetical protein
MFKSLTEGHNNHYEKYKIECHLDILEFKLFELQHKNSKICNNIKKVKLNILRLKSIKKTLSKIKE